MLMTCGREEMTATKSLLILASLLFLIAPAFSWWSGSWDYRIAVNATHPLGNDTCTDCYFIVNVTDSGGKIQDDCDDIRAINATDDTTVLYHNISHANANFCEVKVNVTATAGEKFYVYIYYGNNTVSSGSSDFTGKEGLFVDIDRRDDGTTSWGYCGAGLVGEKTDASTIDTAGQGTNRTFSSTANYPAIRLGMAYYNGIYANKYVDICCTDDLNDYDCFADENGNRQFFHNKVDTDDITIQYDNTWNDHAPQFITVPLGNESSDEWMSLSGDVYCEWIPDDDDGDWIAGDTTIDGDGVADSLYVCADEDTAVSKDYIYRTKIGTEGTINIASIARSGYIVEGVKGSEEDGSSTLSLVLNFPTDGAGLITLTVPFVYTPEAKGGNQQYVNASLWTNATGGVWNWTQLNASAVQNATSNTLSYTFADYGTYLFNVQAFTNATSSSAAANRTVTLSQLAINPPTYTTPVYETDSDDVNVTVQIDNATIDSILGAWLAWNGTEYSPDYESDNGTHFHYGRSLTMPLVETNNTGVSLQWKFAVNYTNGTVLNRTGNAYQQNVTFLFYFNEYSVSPTTVLQGDSFLAWANVTDFAGHAAPDSRNVYFYVNGTYYPATDWYDIALLNDWDPASESIAAPQIPAGVWNYTYATNATLEVSYGGKTLNRTLGMTPINITAYKWALTNCSGWTGNATSLTFTFLREEDGSDEWADMEGTFHAWNQARTMEETYSFTWNGTHVATLCIYPNTTVLVDSVQLYRNETDGLPQRSYFLDNASVSNESQNVYLYLVNGSDAKLTDITVQDYGGQPVTSAFLSFMRYYPGQNVYRTVAMAFTDENGETNVYLVPNDVYYKVQIIRDHAVYYTTSEFTISCGATASTCERGIILSTAYGKYYSYADKLAYSCDFVDATNTSRCTVTDTSGLMQSANMKVEKFGIFAASTVCDTTLSTSSGTLLCSVGSEAGDYVTTLYADMGDGERVLLEQTSKTLGGQAPYGDLGVLLALLIVLTLAFAGLWNPVVAEVFAFLGLLLSVVMGLVFITWGSLVGLLVVAAIHAYKMRA